MALIMAGGEGRKNEIKQVLGWVESTIPKHNLEIPEKFSIVAPTISLKYPHSPYANALPRIISKAYQRVSHTSHPHRRNISLESNKEMEFSRISPPPNSKRNPSRPRRTRRILRLRIMVPKTTSHSPHSCKTIFSNNPLQRGISLNMTYSHKSPHYEKTLQFQIIVSVFLLKIPPTNLKYRILRRKRLLRIFGWVRGVRKVHFIMIRMRISLRRLWDISIFDYFHRR